MSYGEPDRGNHSWSLTEAESRPHIQRALDAGITFFDTANVYSAGSSEEILGRAVRDFASRDDLVIATKVHGRMRPGPSGGGLSRKAIFAAIDESLTRLGRTTSTSIRSTVTTTRPPSRRPSRPCTMLSASGKVRYLGASSMFAWEFSQALYLAQGNGWTPFVSMQDHYNLLNREEEREMFGLCANQGIGVIPWSPLARGRLTRPWEAETNRSGNDAFGSSLYDESDREIVEAVMSVAANRGVPAAQIALAWVLHNPVVSAPIIGATKEKHIDDAVAAVELELTADEVATLEKPYRPHAVAGF